MGQQICVLFIFTPYNFIFSYVSWMGFYCLPFFKTPASLVAGICLNDNWSAFVDKSDPGPTGDHERLDTNDAVFLDWPIFCIW